MDEYLTVRNQNSAVLIEKHSRFIGTCAPVKSRAEADEFVASIRKNYPDATHNVYAYAVRENNYRKYSDDGEPSGTSGMPTLNVILSNKVTDCAIVVTRYFGGILLGTGGLVHAYSATAKLALESAGIIKMAVCDIYSVVFDYNFYQRFLTLLENQNAVCISSDFGEQVTCGISIRHELSENFKAALTEQSCGKVILNFVKSEFCEVKN